MWTHKKIREYVEKQKKGQCTGIDDNLIENIDNIKQEITSKELNINLPDNLSKIEKDVLMYFFEEMMPFDEIAKLMGLRRERVRQIKQKALRKIKINTKLI